MPWSRREELRYENRRLSKAASKRGNPALIIGGWGWEDDQDAEDTINKAKKVLTKMETSTAVSVRLEASVLQSAAQGTCRAFAQLASPQPGNGFLPL